MSPPAVVIRLEFEGRPRVYVDALYQGEKDRLDTWLLNHPDYARLVAQAVELEQRERVA